MIFEDREEMRFWEQVYLQCVLNSKTWAHETPSASADIAVRSRRVRIPPNEIVEVERGT